MEVDITVGQIVGDNRTNIYLIAYELFLFVPFLLYFSMQTLQYPTCHSSEGFTARRGSCWLRMFQTMGNVREAMGNNQINACYPV